MESAAKRQKTATAVAAGEIEAAVRAAVAAVEVVDLHTHLLPPAFGAMMLWGVDELLTYHYLVCEFFQTAAHVRPNEFYALPKVSSRRRRRRSRRRSHSNTPAAAAAAAPQLAAVALRLGAIAASIHTGGLLLARRTSRAT